MQANKKKIFFFKKMYPRRRTHVPKSKIYPVVINDFVVTSKSNKI